MEPRNTIPDLNDVVEETFGNEIPYLNVHPSCHSSNLSSSTQFHFDLNEEPPAEDDPAAEEDLGTEANLGVEEPSAGSASREVGEAERSDSSRLKTLTNEERQAVYRVLLQTSVCGKVHKRIKGMLAASYSVSPKTIERIWTQGKVSGDASHRKTRNCGRKRVQIDLDQFRDTELSKRRTFRTLAAALNTNKSSLSRLHQSGVIRRHSNAIKPFLKEENKRSWLQFCLSMLENGTIPHDPTFKGMYNIIHVDEKWFYMTKKSENYYLLPDEEEPLRTCKSKNFIPKVMFLAAVARPRFDSQRNAIFSGKIGLFPLVTKEPARRTTVNRAAGTIETKPITSVTKEVIKSFLIQNVLPAIKENWPRDEVSCPIIIQQDNARTHIDCNDAEFCQAAAQYGLDIRLLFQPANSPDLNILDLGFFRAIQSLQHNEPSKNIDGLISAVDRAFEGFSPELSDRIFVTLQSCMIEIMKVKGSNNYKIPHMKKSLLASEGRLPSQMKCDPTVVEEVIHHLSSG